MCRLWEEAEYVVKRVNGQIATQALVQQLTILSVTQKGGGAEFKKMMEKLTDGG